MSQQAPWSSALARAIRQGRVRDVRDALQTHPEAVHKPIHLVLAASHGSLPVMTLLIGRGADVDDSFGSLQPIEAAAAANQWKAVSFLLKRGARVPPLQNLRPSILDWAVFHNNAGAARRFVETVPLGTIHRDVPNMLTGELYSLLGHAARMAGDATDIIGILLAHGADPLRETRGSTAVHLAARSGHPRNLECLLDHILENNLYQRGRRVIRGAVGMELRFVDWRDRSGATPLVAAIEGENNYTIPILMGRGADPSAEWMEKKPLHLAAHYGNVTAIRLLLDGGADVDARDAEGRTALYYSASDGVVDALVGAGADVHARDRYGETPLLYTTIHNIASSIDRLRANGARLSGSELAELIRYRKKGWKPVFDTEEQRSCFQQEFQQLSQALMDPLTLSVPRIPIRGIFEDGSRTRTLRDAEPLESYLRTPSETAMQGKDPIQFKRYMDFQQDQQARGSIRKLRQQP